MPELPEVETVRRSLEPRMVGRTFTSARVDGSSRFTDATQVVGAGIRAVRRRGKYVLVDLDDDRELVVHLGMTGVVTFRDPADPPTPHVRAEWELDDGTRVELSDPRKFGRVSVVPAGEYTGLATLANLGPEPLEEGFDQDAFVTTLRRGGAPVKAQLLDQRLVAGVGNIYADEALWAAGIHPATPGRDVPEEAARRLHGTVVEALRSGLERRGTTLRDYRTVEGTEGSNQHHLQCYGRSGQECNRCGAQLERSVVAGRGTTSCPTCQQRDVAKE